MNIQVGIGTASYDAIAVDLNNNHDAMTMGIHTINTVLDAQDEMDTIDVAIDSVSAARADFGAIQNRLESSIRNVANTAENLSAANSRIRDVDIANESSKMISAQIL